MHTVTKKVVSVFVRFHCAASVEQPDVLGLVASFLVGNIMLLVLNVPLIGM
jgi:hypothetical protein